MTGLAVGAAGQYIQNLGGGGAGPEGRWEKIPTEDIQIVSGAPVTEFNSAREPRSTATRIAHG